MGAGVQIRPDRVDQPGGQQEEGGGDPVGRVGPEKADGESRERHGDEQRDDHRAGEHRGRRHQFLAPHDEGDGRRLGGGEDLTDRGEEKDDEEQMPGDMLEIGNELAERDQQDQAAADSVGGEHQSLLVVPVGVHPGEWTEEDGGERVREKEGGAVGTGAADAVGEDQQREHQELVGQL